MHTALALAPLTLAAVLVLSGLAKRPDPGSTHSMMTQLRLPPALANTTVARLLPWGELGVAALLLTPWLLTYAVGTLAAFLLFLTFWVIIARAMTFDPRPSCGCFGRVGDHRITGRTVARNTILLALAILSGVVALLGRTGTGLLTRFDAGDWWWLGLAVALAALTWFVLAAPSSGPDEPTHGRTPVPGGILVGPDHRTTSLHQLSRQGAQLVFLANCWCGSTVAALDRLPVWRARLPQVAVPFVHTLRPFDEPRLSGVPDVWWDPGSQVYDALRGGPSPAAVLLGADGLLAGGPVNGVEQIEAFVEDIAVGRVGAELPDPEAPARPSPAAPQRAPAAPEP